MVITIHLWLWKTVPGPATRPLSSVHPLEHRSNSPVEMQKHVAASIWKSSFPLPIRREQTWTERVAYETIAMKCALPLCHCLVSHSLITSLPNSWQVTKGQDGVIPASVCIGYYSRISYSLLLHLTPGFVLFRERCHLPLHSTDLWMTVLVH